MKFPSFDEFEATLTMEQIQEWVNDANDAEIKVSLPLTVFNVRNFMTSQATADLMICKSMLRDYHEWLSKELEKSSLRLVRD